MNYNINFPFISSLYSLMCSDERLTANSLSLLGEIDYVCESNLQPHECSQ